MAGRLFARPDGGGEILVHLFAAPVFLRRSWIRFRLLAQKWTAALRHAALGADPDRASAPAAHLLGHGLAAIVVVDLQRRMDAALGPLEPNDAPIRVLIPGHARSFKNLDSGKRPRIESPDDHVPSV